jgi:carbon starvation protein
MVAADERFNAVVLPLLKSTQTVWRNNLIDAYVTIFFLALVAAIVLISLWEWWRLLRGAKPAKLSETAPVWIPADALQPSSAAPALGIIALSLTLLKEVSGEAALDRAQLAAAPHNCPAAQTPRARRNVYLTATDERFRGIRNCC